MVNCLWSSWLLGMIGNLARHCPRQVSLMGWKGGIRSSTRNSGIVVIVSSTCGDTLLELIVIFPHRHSRPIGLEALRARLRTQ